MSNHTIVRLLSAIYFLWLPTFAFGQEAKLDSLLHRSPSPANAIGYMHIPALKKLLADANIPLTIDDGVEDVWLVSELNTSSLVPNWEAGYATVSKTLDADKLAVAMDGYVDKIGDQPVVWTPKQSYLVPLSDNRIGFLRPARRSLAASWINSQENNPIPAYLTQQAKQPEAFLSLMLAVDLENAFSPARLASRLSSFESLGNQDPQALAQLLSSVQGLSIIVGRRSLSECILSVQFGQSPAEFAPHAAAVLNEVLNNNGTAAPEVASWKTKVDGNSLTFQGPISANSLDGVLNVFSLQSYAAQVVKESSKPAETAATGTGQGGDSRALTATKTYFDSVKGLVERVRNYDAKTTGYRAKWDQQQARRLDELPTLNVDPQMLDYGVNVASILRGNGVAIQTGSVNASGGVHGRGQASGYGYYGGYYGDSYGVSRQALAEVGSYHEAMATVDKLTGEVRRAMTEKYQTQF
jgi:hypothetical protein